MNASLHSSSSPCYRVDGDGHYALVGAFTKEEIPFHDLVLYGVFASSSPRAINLTQVSFCDSAFIALMVAYKKAFPQMYYTGVSESIQRLMDIYGVSELLLGTRIDP